jgi:transglutaminase-like putative cysteine protease
MIFEVGCELRYEVTAPTTLFLSVDVSENSQQLVLSQDVRSQPSLSTETYRYPNTGTVYRRMLLPVGEVVITAAARVDLRAHLQPPDTVREIPVDQLPLSVIPFLFPSRYCQSDELARFALRQFGSIERGYVRVTEICNWIYREVDYLSGSSDAATSAADSFKLRAGVCRDFAHLGITFCRALGIPARFVSVYGWQLAPQDFHAVFEAYLGGRWYLFDATRQGPLDGIVRISVGRDAGDTAFATYYGTMKALPKRVWIEPEGTGAAGAPWTVEAVSVAET